MDPCFEKLGTLLRTGPSCFATSVKKFTISHYVCLFIRDAGTLEIYLRKRNFDHVYATNIKNRFNKKICHYLSIWWIGGCNFQPIHYIKL